MRAQIEKAMALIRQGQSMKALRVLGGVVQQLPEEDDEDTGEITLELAIPMEFPSVDFQTSEDGQHFLLVDKENAWVIGAEEEEELKALCYPLRDLRYLDASDLNVYKMSVSAKLKEMVLAERVTKR